MVNGSLVESVQCIFAQVTLEFSVVLFSLSCRAYICGHHELFVLTFQALTLSNLDHWPRGPVDLRSYWPEGQ